MLTSVNPLRADGQQRVARNTKAPEGLVFRGLTWLRGLDLNQRPLGYEGKIGHHSSQDERSQTNDDKALANQVVGAFWVISVALLHSRFIGFNAALALTLGPARAA
jgi:hypothetical protein